MSSARDSSCNTPTWYPFSVSVVRLIECQTIATYPKCGTTWMQQIVLLLMNNGDHEKVRHPMEQAPWLEAMISGKAILKDPSAKFFVPPVHPDEYRSMTDDPRVVWKTHAPSGLVPWSNGLQNDTLCGKVIVVSRNSKDAAVSLLHHTNDGPFGFTGAWADFAELFLAGTVESGSFWEWHKGWWAAKDANTDAVLWVQFEALKEDLRGQVERVARFIGCELEEEALDRVAEHSTFEAMKAQFKRIEEEKQAAGEMFKKNHIRRGKVGSWRELFDVEQSAAFDQKDEQYGASEWSRLL
eukprot:TRINITY_DN3129_c0_g1_i5.p1 TRINITY_DN3129_c0_g1~~TRINITY_DN3129_c0_g1_i5.p1  ORF type:complete len:297 (-),score=76.34 TRINITY_DN3129_c0_g1_i5:63-953(-)